MERKKKEYDITLPISDRWRIAFIPMNVVLQSHSGTGKGRWTNYRYYRNVGQALSGCLFEGLSEPGVKASGLEEIKRLIEDRYDDIMEAVKRWPEPK